MANGTSSLFSLAVTSAMIRCYQVGLSGNQEQMCNSFVLGFGVTPSLNKSIFQQFISNGNIKNILGFENGSPYSSIENTIYNIFDSFFPTQSSSNKTNLAIATNAFILGYFVYSDVDINTVQQDLAHVLLYVSQLINGEQIFFEDGKNFVDSPITNDVINQLLNENYSEVLGEIATSPKDTFTEMVNYNWYESEGLFATPNLQIMKDIENQYYFISGQLIYNANEEKLEECIEVPISITTNTGIINSYYIKNTPCTDLSTYIGPVTGIKFHRIFNDGPPSVGDFTEDIEQEYLNFDKSGLLTSQYSSNNEVIYSFTTGSDSGYIPVCNNSVFIDGVGEYNLSQEYSTVPQPFSCTNTYQSMHIGGNQQQIICQIDSSGHCFNCQATDVTGFKFATLELDPNIWFNDFAYLQTNPYSDPNSILKRALNLNTYSYISRLNSEVFNTVNSDGLEYFSYPQITGTNSLPNLAFFQTFDNLTFGTKASLVLFPSVGTSNNGDGDESDRYFTVSPLQIFSGIAPNSISIEETGQVALNFSNTISSKFTNDDSIAKQFFGMGDSFGSDFVILSTVNSNAGYIYSGYVISGSGIFMNLTQYNEFNSESILGSPVENIQFISGYSDSFNNLYIPTQLFGQDATGGLISYYYLDNRNLSESNQVQENQWSYFSPLPQPFEESPNFNRVIGEQKVENYLPRYASGAYSNQFKTFIYPNAASANTIYSANTQGFISKIKFTLNIREESVRELYAKFFIGTDGIISTIPSNIRVIRPTTDNGIDLSADSPVMNDIFIPDNPFYNTQYDFNNLNVNNNFAYFASLLGLVDNNYSPKVNGIIPSGKNSNTYTNNGNAFIQGIRFTGDTSTLINKFFTGTGSDDFINLQSINPLSNGLWHYYRGLQISGLMEYTPPIFNLESGEIYINQNIQDAFPVMVNGATNASCRLGNDGCAQVGGAVFTELNGYFGIIEAGFDPIFLRYMGGRSGGYLTNQEGGYHPNNIIGDIWNNFYYFSYGMRGNPDGCGSFLPCYDCGVATRWPNRDQDIIIVSAATTGINIYTRALMYNPGILNDIPFLPFNGTESYNYNLGNTNGSIALTFSGDYGSFNLNQYIPRKTVLTNQFYDPTGLVIGPFDRDIEFGVLAGNSIFCNGNLYLNGNQLTDPSGLGGCDSHASQYGMQAPNTGIIPAQKGRDMNYTIFGVIPQGDTAIFNIKSLNSGSLHFNNNQSTVSLRPRKTIGARPYNTDVDKGEETWTNPLYFLKNGVEQQFSIQTNRFEDLLSNNFTFTTFINSGELYPIPNQDFTGQGSFDKFGNLIYPSNATVENYWKKYAIRNNQIVVISGWREGGRISFDFQDIEFIYDKIPYQTEVLITPSGTCTVTGQFGYLSQAEASIYSAGVYLTDNTAPIPNNSGDYQPYYFSPVLNRLPSVQQPPTGQYNRPVLEAPSVMIQRKFIPEISGEQEYNKLLNFSPNNYNKFSWAALSDLETLNPNETIEMLPTNDSITFTNSSLLFSAAQGQPLPNGKTNPIINKTFDVTAAYQLYDSISTDAILNLPCITQNVGTQVRLDNTNLSGFLAPLGTTVSMIKQGFLN